MNHTFSFQIYTFLDQFQATNALCVHSGSAWTGEHLLSFIPFIWHSFILFWSSLHSLSDIKVVLGHDESRLSLLHSWIAALCDPCSGLVTELNNTVKPVRRQGVLKNAQHK